jgi:hypothetical protein
MGSETRSLTPQEAQEYQALRQQVLKELKQIVTAALEWFAQERERHASVMARDLKRR